MVINYNIRNLIISKVALLRHNKRMEALNAEYHTSFLFNGTLVFRHIVSINRRNLQEPYIYKSIIKWTYPRIAARKFPKRYFYSSGFNNLSGYKNY